jgi:hypothetical protein
LAKKLKQKSRANDVIVEVMQYRSGNQRSFSEVARWLKSRLDNRAGVGWIGRWTGFLFAFALICTATIRAESPKEPVDFDTQIMPLFSMYGCNAAECHGAAGGAGGFKLSLFGGGPARDFAAVVHDLEGRRVNVVHPDRSLLLTKPTAQIEHGGDERFGESSTAASLLQTWISQGAERQQLKRLTSLLVTPNRIQAKKLPHKFAIAVTASFDDGSQRNVTDEAIFVSRNESALQIKNGRAVLLKPGLHTFYVRFVDQIQTIEVFAPFDREAPEDLLRFNEIDDPINTTIRDLHLRPAPMADDRVFLRRITLDLAGRLPTPDEFTIFRESNSPFKRSERIDQLLDSREFATYWSYLLLRQMNIRPPRDEISARGFRDWFTQQLADDRSWREITTQVLLATGDSHAFGPAGFQRIATDPRAASELVTQAFMGVRMRCANCHNHPLDRWTQDDYHGLAAIFAKINGQNRIVSIYNDGKVIHPETGEPARTKLPGLIIEDELNPQQFAEWLTSDENEYFAAAFTNRIWAALLGRGIIDPVDDLRITNPSSNPELHQLLIQQFRREGYRLKPLIKSIVESAAYQRATLPDLADSDSQFWTSYMVKPLPAAVYIDAIDGVLRLANLQEQVADRFEPAIKQFSADSQPSISLLEDCDKNSPCREIELSTSIKTQLHLINGELLNSRIERATQLLQSRLEKGESAQKILAEFYLLIFSRALSQEEIAFWEMQLTESDPIQNNAQKLGDALWSLLGSREFRTNH